MFESVLPKVSGEMVRSIREEILGLTQRRLGKLIEPKLFNPPKDLGAAFSRWETAVKQFPSDELARVTIEFFYDEGVDKILVDELKETFEQERRSREEAVISDRRGVRVLDSSQLRESLQRLYKSLNNENPVDTELSILEHLLTFLPLYPDVFSLENAINIALRFFGLRFEILGQLGDCILAGKRIIDPNKINLYHHPKPTPQLCIVPIPLKANVVDFRRFSDVVQVEIFNLLMQKLKYGDWTDKSEAGFLLKQLPFIVPQGRGREVAEEMIYGIDPSGDIKSLWSNWQLSRQQFLSADSLNKECQQKLRHCSENHPEIISKMAARLAFPIDSVKVYYEFCDIIPAIYASQDFARGNEHVGCYAMFEYFNVSRRIHQEIRDYLPTEPLLMNLDLVRAKGEWSTAQSLVPWLVESIAEYFHPDDRLKLRKYL